MLDLGLTPALATLLERMQRLCTEAGGTFTGTSTDLRDRWGPCKGTSYSAQLAALHLLGYVVFQWDKDVIGQFTVRMPVCP